MIYMTAPTLQKNETDFLIKKDGLTIKNCCVTQIEVLLSYFYMNGFWYDWWPSKHKKKFLKMKCGSFATLFVYQSIRHHFKEII
jgi:hypothetical protein